MEFNAIGRFSNFDFTKLKHWKFLTVTVDIGGSPFIRGCQSVSLSRLPTTPPPQKKKGSYKHFLKTSKRNKLFRLITNIMSVLLCILSPSGGVIKFYFVCYFLEATYNFRFYALSNRIYCSNAVGGFPTSLVLVNLLKSLVNRLKISHILKGGHLFILYIENAQTALLLISIAINIQIPK